MRQARRRGRAGGGRGQGLAKSRCCCPRCDAPPAHAATTHKGQQLGGLLLPVKQVGAGLALLPLALRLARLLHAPPLLRHRARGRRRLRSSDSPALLLGGAGLRLARGRGGGRGGARQGGPRAAVDFVLPARQPVVGGEHFVHLVDCRGLWASGEVQGGDATVQPTGRTPRPSQPAPAARRTRHQDDDRLHLVPHNLLAAQGAVLPGLVLVAAAAGHTKRRCIRRHRASSGAMPRRCWSCSQGSIPAAAHVRPCFWYSLT